MTFAIDTVITLGATAAGFVFLAVSAWHNHRSGYRKIRPSQSPVEEAMQWLSTLNGSPACEEVPLPSTNASTVSATITGADLLALETALGRAESPAPAADRAPAAVSARATHEETDKTLRAA